MPSQICKSIQGQKLADGVAKVGGRGVLKTPWLVVTDSISLAINGSLPYPAMLVFGGICDHCDRLTLCGGSTNEEQKFAIDMHCCFVWCLLNSGSYRYH
jgi:hypothetical protein